MSPRRIAKALAYAGASALAAILIVTVWLVHEHREMQALQRVVGLAPNALLHARSFHWTEMKGDETQWTLSAREASYSTDRKSLVLSGAELSMTSNDGKHVELSAPVVELRLEGNHVSRADLSGGLQIGFGNFVTTTDSATFFPDRDELDAPGAVRIKGDGIMVTGTGLKSHPKERLFALEHEVSTEIVPRGQTSRTKIL